MIRSVAACTLVIVAASATAQAQYATPAGVPYGGTEVFVGSSYAYPASAPIGYSAPTTINTYVPPYSYYVAPYPLPARPYVGYGSADIYPYYGRAYGHPYDPWTWPYLSIYPTDALARYYYAPVR